MAAWTSSGFFGTSVGLYVQRLGRWLALPTLLWLGYLLFVLSGGAAISPPWSLAALLVLLGVFTGIRLLKGIWRSRWPAKPLVEHRVEQRNKLVHQPFTAQRDEKASGSQQLWQLHQWQQQETMQQRLRTAWPKISLKPLLAIVMVLIMGTLLGGSNVTSYLSAGFTPKTAIPGLTEQPAFQVTVQPPSYTRLPAYSLVSAPKQAIPTGSTVTVQTYQQGWPKPSIKYGVDKLATTKNDSGYTASTELQAADELSIRSGLQQLYKQSLRLKPDATPTALLTEDVSGTRKGLLRLPYVVADDYGVTKLVVALHLTEAPDTIETFILWEDDSEDPKGRPHVTATGYLDVGPHPWAGQEVTVQLVVTDAVGNTGRSIPQTTALPVRIFKNPVAKKLIDIRQSIREEEGKDAIPSALVEMRRLLVRPASYRHDVVVFLNLRSMLSRLLLEEVDGLQEQLWFTAVRVEDGAQGEALTEAAQVLQELLNSPDASNSEIRRALQELMQKLAQNAPSANPGNQLPFSGPSLIDQIEQLLSEGKKEEALQALNELLEQLQQAAANQEQLEETFQQLADVIEKQEELAEKTEGANPAELPELAQQQQALQQDLQEAIQSIEELGMEAPAALREAGADMQAAADALRDGDKPGAKQAQQAALQKLQQGNAQTMQQAAQRFVPIGTASGRRDGRGQQFNEDLVVPERGENNLREILDILRSRVNEVERPAEEREYLRRLLEEF